MSRLRFGLIGHPDTGKQAAGEYLGEKYGFKVINTGQIIQELAGEQTLSSKKDIFKFQYDVRQRSVEKIKFIGEYVLSLTDERVAVVGLRNKYDALAIHQSGGSLISLGYGVKVPGSQNGNAPDPDHLDFFGDHINWLIEHSDYQITAPEAGQSIHQQLDQIVELELTKPDNDQ